MTTFSVPTHGRDGGFFDFRVATGSVMFAGSRHLEIPQQVCSDLIKAFGFHGFSFITGCASGVDHSFRRALALSESKESSLVACAFKERAERIRDICSLFVVPEDLLFFSKLFSTHLENYSAQIKKSILQLLKIINCKIDIYYLF